MIASKSFVKNYNKRSIPGKDTKYWLGFSHICSEYYELYLNFDETETNLKKMTCQTITINTFAKNIVFIEEELIYGVNLTDSSAFPPNLIKCENFIFNQGKITCDKTLCIHKIEIKNGCIIQVFWILRE